MGGKKPLRRPLWPPTRATASNYYPLGLDGAGGAAKPLLRAPKKPAPLHGRLPAFSGAVDAFERARKCFLEWRYFFSIILSEFLKNRVALQEDNIYLPLVLMGMSYENMRARLLPVARELGLTELLKKYPYEVSGGQKQRAAVARAIITEPKLLLADEPTGALDSGSTDELLRLFAAINRAGQTILMVTHSVKAASRAGRVLFIKDGQVFHQLYRGEDDDTRFYQRISDTLTMLQSGGEPA